MWYCVVLEDCNVVFVYEFCYFFCIILDEIEFGVYISDFELFFSEFKVVFFGVEDC